MLQKLTLEQMREIARRKGGRVISSEYINSKTHLVWECSKGHRWPAIPESVKRGTWCRKCASRKPRNNPQRRKKMLNRLREIAKERSGELVSNEYINQGHKLLWKCSKGHKWEARAGSVKAGSWCNRCSNDVKRLSLNEVKDFVRKKFKGKCLSSKYINSHQKLHWECKEGHTFHSIFTNVRSGKWCKKCNSFPKVTIERMNKLAKSRGGLCLSKSIKNRHTNLQWQCLNGHTWENTPGNIMKGSWCGRCNRYLSEDICRTIFEQLFNRKFPRYKPGWLKIGEKSHLELDGYCEELKIAFEYHGEHHFMVTRQSFSNETLLKKRKKLDTLKRELCKKNKVFLYEIKYSDDLTKLPILIKKISNQNKISIPRVNFEKKINFEMVYQSRSKINELQKIAEDKKGKLVSTCYLNNNAKLTWECEKGHRWYAGSRTVISGYWCKECNKQSFQNSQLKIMRDFAKLHEGECLSKTYTNADTKLTWKCSRGHIMEISRRSMQRKKYWCTECKKQIIKT